MKKNATLILILVLLLGFGAFAQNYVILVRPTGSKDWGYADLKGNLTIDAKFRKCAGFSEDGLAPVYDPELKQFYFINLKGEILQTEVNGFKLIEILGFGMKGFSDGLAPVKLHDKWGYLDTEGKLAIHAVYDKVTPFNSGYASVQKEGKFIVLDKKGTEYPVAVQGIKDLNDFSELLASFKQEDGQVGFVDGSGKVAIEAKFLAAGDFSGGMAWAKCTAGTIGYINPNGDYVLEAKYDVGKNFDPVSGVARIKTGDKWAYLNKAGEIHYMGDSDLFEDFSDGLARGRKNDKFGFFNSKMEWAIKPQFDGARDFKNGYAAVKSGSLWGVIDKSGNWVIDPKFDEIKDVEIVKH